jgi:hypothetical protein
VTALRDQRRTMVLEAREARVARVLGEDPSPLSGAPDFALGEAADDELVGVPSGNGHRHGADALGALSLHRPPWWRRIHPRVAIATGLIAFVIALGALTLPELIFGGAVASNHRTTFFGGGSSHSSQTQTTKTSTTTTATSPTTSTVTVPAQTPTGSQTTTTTTTGTQTTGTTTAPSGGAPAPSGTSTTPTSTSGTPPPPSG